MTLTLVTPEQRDRLLAQQHLVLKDVSWSFYQRVLDELGDRPTRVTYRRAWVRAMATS